jgi:hypothetical protein
VPRAAGHSTGAVRSNPALGDFLAEMLISHDSVAKCHMIDRRGREVFQVVLGGTDVVLEQTRSGIAWPDRFGLFADAVFVASLWSELHDRRSRAQRERKLTQRATDDQCA